MYTASHPATNIPSGNTTDSETYTHCILWQHCRLSENSLMHDGGRNGRDRPVPYKNSFSICVASQQYRYNIPRQSESVNLPPPVYSFYNKPAYRAKNKVHDFSHTACLYAPFSSKSARHYQPDAATVPLSSPADDRYIFVYIANHRFLLPVPAATMHISQFYLLSYLIRINPLYSSNIRNSHKKETKKLCIFAA